MSLTLIFPVYSAPSNTVDSTLLISEFVYGDVSQSLNISVPFGKLYYINVSWTGDYPPTESRYINGSININTYDWFDIYIAVNRDNSDYSINVPFVDCFNAGQSFTSEDRPYGGSNIIYDSDYDTVSVSQITSSLTKMDVYYNAYISVPAGSYNLDWEAIYTDTNPADSDFYIGVYAVEGVDPNAPDWSSDPVGGFEHGYYDFEEALNQLITNMENILDYSMNYEYNNFYVNYTSTQIEILKSKSDIKYNSVVSSFDENAESIIQEYEDSGSVDPSPYIDELSMFFTDSLSQAVTSEQGTYLSSIFQNLLAKLQLAFDFNYKKELDEVVSDEEIETNHTKLDHVSMLEVFEKDARELFQQSEYENILNFLDWLDALGDASNYRNIFNFFFNDSGYIKYFLTIPLSLVLVSLVLGTTTSVFRSNRREERYHNNNHKQDKGN